MKILTVIYELPPIGGGGGKAAYDVCKELVLRGHDVAILTSHFKGLPFEETQDGIRIMRVAAFRREAFRADFFTMLAYIVAGFFAGLRLIRNNRPDVMHVHFAVPSGALAWALSVFTGVPYILTAHLGDVPDGVPEKTGKWFRWLTPFTKPIWKRAKQVVAVSEFTRQLALKNYPVNIQVIPNGADIARLAPREIKLNAPPRIVFAGRFVPQKNPLAIVQVLSQLKDLNWNCSMLGDGLLLDEVKRAVEKANMSDRFEFTGWITTENVLNHFSRSDILFMPSLSEGLPVVGVQALAKGLAVVASDIGGFLDLVDDGGNGYLIHAQNQTEFAQALRGLISSPEVLSRFRQASLEKARQFDIQKVAESYQIILQSAAHF